MLKAACLRPDDRVMLISPAAGLAGIFPHRVENGIKAIEKLGYKALEGANARLPGRMAGTPAQRAADIHYGLQQPAVKALVANIGGDYVCWEVLKALDWDLVRQHPKIFMGFSDLTALLLGLYTRTGLVTFYGPMVITQFGEYPRMHPYTVKWLLKALTSVEPIGPLEPALEWTDEMLDWAQKLDLSRPRQLQPSAGWEWLQAGQAQGKLLGGCIQVLVDMYQHVPQYLPDFSEAIFFWESAESSPGVGHTPQQVAESLRFLKQKGLLTQMRAMIVGRPYQYSPEWHAALKALIISIVDDPNKPILYNLETGHTDPILTLPIGVQATLDAARQLFSLDEAALIV